MSQADDIPPAAKPPTADHMKTVLPALPGDALKHCPSCGWTKIVNGNLYTCYECETILETIKFFR